MSGVSLPQQKQGAQGAQWQQMRNQGPETHKGRSQFYTLANYRVRTIVSIILTGNPGALFALLCAGVGHEEISLQSNHRAQLDNHELTTQMSPEGTAART